MTTSEHYSLLVQIIAAVIGVGVVLGVAGMVGALLRYVVWPGLRFLFLVGRLVVRVACWPWRRRQPAPVQYVPLQLTPELLASTDKQKERARWS